jgi:S-formylglutathione hydrolase FrmB
MITRKEAEAYEKDARAEERLAAAEKKMYGALSEVLKLPKKQNGAKETSPKLSGRAAAGHSVPRKK